MLTAEIWKPADITTTVRPGKKHDNQTDCKKKEKKKKKPFPQEIF